LHERSGRNALTPFKVLQQSTYRVYRANSILTLVAANDELEIPYSDDSAAWNGFVESVNKSIDTLDLEFRHLNDEVTGTEMFAVVSQFLE
jgi:hypothetical protein